VMQTASGAGRTFACAARSAGPSESTPGSLRGLRTWPLPSAFSMRGRSESSRSRHPARSGRRRKRRKGLHTVSTSRDLAALRAGWPAPGGDHLSTSPTRPPFGSALEQSRSDVQGPVRGTLSRLRASAAQLQARGAACAQRSRQASATELAAGWRAPKLLPGAPRALGTCRARRR
jgi:hypothetical protein